MPLNLGEELGLDWTEGYFYTDSFSDLQYSKRWLIQRWSVLILDWIGKHKVEVGISFDCNER